MGDLNTVYGKKMQPGALLWDYENWLRIRISKEERRGAVVLFSCVGWFCTVLSWVILGWVRLLLPVPWIQGPFFSCQSQPDVPRLALRILIPHSVLLCKVSHTSCSRHTPNLVGQVFSYADRNTHTWWQACRQTRFGWDSLITWVQKESQSRNRLQ